MGLSQNTYAPTVQLRRTVVSTTTVTPSASADQLRLSAKDKRLTVLISFSPLPFYHVLKMTSLKHKIHDVDGDDDCYQKEMNDIAAKKQMFFSSNCGNGEISNHCKERNRCMKCSEGGQLLVCSSESCSFVFHDNCLVFTSDTTGEFYCPFCRYSQLVLDYWIVKKKASLAGNDVASFNGWGLKSIPKMSHENLCVSDSDQTKPCTTFALPQRRRLPVPWTKLEEDTLKKWVEKFSRNSDGDFVPWRRILELGVSVFQKSRTSVDLKDKWRNMQKASKNST